MGDTVKDVARQLIDTTTAAWRYPDIVGDAVKDVVRQLAGVTIAVWRHPDIVMTVITTWFILYCIWSWVF